MFVVQARKIAASLAVAAVVGGSVASVPLAQAQRCNHHHHRHCIPQHNGGDHDADNNGGPSDGDGNI